MIRALYCSGFAYLQAKHEAENELLNYESLRSWEGGLAPALRHDSDL
jgi:hypothetical protein